MYVYMVQTYMYKSILWCISYKLSNNLLREHYQPKMGLINQGIKMYLDLIEDFCPKNSFAIILIVFRSLCKTERITYCGKSLVSILGNSARSLYVSTSPQDPLALRALLFRLLLVFAND